MKKASAISTLIIIIILFSLSTFVNSQTDSCSSNLNLDGLPFDPSSLQCLPVWDSRNYVLRYVQALPDTWNFVLSAQDLNSYVAMGFSSTGFMVGSSAVVGWIPATGGAGIIKQYYLGGRSPSEVKPDQDNLKINFSMIFSQSSRIYLAFQLITEQAPSSRLIYSLGPPGVLPSAPNYGLTEHRDKVSTILNYVTGQTAEKSSHTGLRRSHGALNMLSWGILMMIGAMVARHMKDWDPLWFYAHVCIQSLGFIIGVAGIICGFILEDRISDNVSTHKGIGIFILALGCLQMMSFLARPDKTTKVRKYWNWYHHGVGRTLIVFAIANVFYGIHLGEEGHGWYAGYGIVLAFLFVVAVVLEARLWMRK